MKRTTLKRKSPSSQAKLERELWQLCRKVADKRWKPVCFICQKPVEGSNKQLGHFIPKAACGAYLKYDMRNLRWSCYYDNINLGGNGSMFYRRLVEEEGQQYVDELFTDKNRIVKAVDRYLELKRLYEIELGEYTNNGSLGA